MGHGGKPNPNQLSDQPDVLCPERPRERFSPGGFVLPATVDNGHAYLPPNLILLNGAGTAATSRWFCDGKQSTGRFSDPPQVFKTLKSELIWPVAWQSRQQAENTVARYIDGFHTPIRRHSSLCFQSPCTSTQKARKMRETLSAKDGQLHSGAADPWRPALLPGQSTLTSRRSGPRPAEPRLRATLLDTARAAPPSRRHGSAGSSTGFRRADRAVGRWFPDDAR